MTAGLPLLKYLLTPLAKRVLIPLELTAAASATDAVIRNKFFCIKDDNIKNFKKRNEIKSLEESGSLIKRVSTAIKNEVRKKRRISPGFVKYISCQFLRK